SNRPAKIQNPKSKIQNPISHSWALVEAAYRYVDVRGDSGRVSAGRAGARLYHGRSRGESHLFPRAVRLAGVAGVRGRRLVCDRDAAPSGARRLGAEPRSRYEVRSGNGAGAAIRVSGDRDGQHLRAQRVGALLELGPARDVD